MRSADIKGACAFIDLTSYASSIRQELLANDNEGLYSVVTEIFPNHKVTFTDHDEDDFHKLSAVKTRDDKKLFFKIEITNEQALKEASEALAKDNLQIVINDEMDTSPSNKIS